MARPLKKPRTEFAAWLRNLRTEAGLSRRQVCQIVRQYRPTFTVRSLSMWELDGTMPTRLEITALCNAYKCTPEKLLGIEQGPNRKYNFIVDPPPPRIPTE
jgi:transcriptional regulator with XRE-family HTH domain